MLTVAPAVRASMNSLFPIIVLCGNNNLFSYKISRVETNTELPNHAHNSTEQKIYLIPFWFDDSLQMGCQCKKALVTESVRESLHSWCKRVKHKSKHDLLHSHTARSVCSLKSTIDERDEITVVSSTLPQVMANFIYSICLHGRKYANKPQYVRILHGCNCD